MQKVIKARIYMAIGECNKMKKLFCSSMNMETGKRCVKCYEWSALLYRSETREETGLKCVYGEELRE